MLQYLPRQVVNGSQPAALSRRRIRARDVEAFVICFVGLTRFAVYAYGMAPLSRIHSNAALVSRPPENAMPTLFPVGRCCRMVAIELFGEPRGKRQAHHIGATLYAAIRSVRFEERTANSQRSGTGLISARLS